MYRLKNKLGRALDLMTAEECWVSIGDIMNCRGQIEHNQFLTVSRLLDIQDFCENGVEDFNWQNTISYATYGKSHDKRGGDRAFKDLIASYMKKGYDSKSIITLDANGRLLDGNHRMGMNVYTGVSFIRARILKRKSKNPKSIDEYLTLRLDGSFIQAVLDKYNDVQKQLISSGNTFAAVVGKNNSFSDFESLVCIKNKQTYSGCTSMCVWGGMISLKKACSYSLH
jgi:hypothetical protein